MVLRQRWTVLLDEHERCNKSQKTSSTSFFHKIFNLNGHTIFISWPVMIYKLWSHLKSSWFLTDNSLLIVTQYFLVSRNTTFYYVSMSYGLVVWHITIISLWLYAFMQLLCTSPPYYTTFIFYLVVVCLKHGGLDNVWFRCN